MQQFMEEVVDSVNSASKPHPKSVKVVSKANHGKGPEERGVLSGRSSSKESPNSKLQGKWRERFESAKQIPAPIPAREEYLSVETDQQTTEPQSDKKLQQAYEAYFSQQGSFTKPKFVEEAILKETQQSYFQKENKPDNKWMARKPNPSAAAQKLATKPPQINQLNQRMEAAIMKKEIEKGGNANQILKRAAKNLEQHDPELAAKAQEYFFEKIGVALLNNFKKNLVPCASCGRNFDSSTLG